MTIIDTALINGVSHEGINMPSGFSDSTHIYSKKDETLYGTSNGNFPTSLAGIDGVKSTRSFEASNIGDWATIMNAKGRGNFTHALSPTILSADFVEIKVDIDGKIYIFKSGSKVPANGRLWVGGFIRGITPYTVSGDSNYFGGNKDIGSGVSIEPNVLGLTSQQAVSQGFGIPFDNYCKVSCKVASSDIHATGNYNNGIAAYARR